MDENELKCPNCDYDLDGIGDRYGFEGDYSWMTMIGTCPICGRTYRWEEIYAFSRIQNLEEVTE
jgi:hypothetical protein